MYHIILDQGIVVRDSDNKIVAPCQSEFDDDFMEYQVWVMIDGNQPVTYATAPVDSPYYQGGNNGQ